MSNKLYSHTGASSSGKCTPITIVEDIVYEMESQNATPGITLFLLNFKYHTFIFKLEKNIFRFIFFLTLSNVQDLSKNSYLFFILTIFRNQWRTLTKFYLLEFNRYTFSGMIAFIFHLCQELQHSYLKSVEKI